VDPRGSTQPRADESALLYRKIAELEADATEAEARALKAEREQGAADEMLGQMLARVSEVETQSERLRVDLTQARREATTHRLAAEDALHLLATTRDETAELRARLDREQDDREALWARIAEQDKLGGERDHAGARARELAADIETLRQAAATHERELSAKLEQARIELRHAHEGADVLDDQLVDARRQLATARDAEKDARRELEGARLEIDAARAEVAEAQSLLAGEREWVAEMEEDNLRREDDLEKTRRAQSRAEAYARAAEARRIEIEDSFTEAERTIAVGRGEIEALRVEAVMHRMRIAEMDRERELRAGLIEVNAVPAEIERLRRRVASAEARAGQMHSELAGAIDEVTLLLTELERRELDTARVRTASLAGARRMLEHVAAATRPVTRPAIEAATSAPIATTADAPSSDSSEPASAPPEPAASPELAAAPPPLPSLAVDDDDEATLIVSRRALSSPTEP
jgi:chromosome segregation ATPase